MIDAIGRYKFVSMHLSGMIKRMIPDDGAKMVWNGALATEWMKRSLR